jgi:predicted kinase
VTRPLLLVFAGLPGTGKSTLAQWISRRRGAAYLRVDAAETALARSGAGAGASGYAVVHELAVGNLGLGHDVVVDAVNPVPVARAGWHEAAERGRADLVFLETTLPDEVEHRRRIEERVPELPGHVLPTWQEVQDCDWVPWEESRDGSRLVIDTADLQEACRRMVTGLAALHPGGHPSAAVRQELR